MKTKTLKPLLLSISVSLILLFSSCDLINLGGNKLTTLKKCTVIDVLFMADISNSDGVLILPSIGSTVTISWNGNNFTGESEATESFIYKISGNVSDDGKTIETLTLECNYLTYAFDESFEVDEKFVFQNVPYSSSYTQTGDVAYGYKEGNDNSNYVKSYYYYDKYLDAIHKEGYGKSASIDYSESDLEINFYNEEYEFFDDL